MSFVVSGFASQISVSTEPSALNVIGPLDVRQWLVLRLRFRATIGGQPLRPLPVPDHEVGRAPPGVGSLFSVVSGLGAGCSSAGLGTSDVGAVVGACIDSPTHCSGRDTGVLPDQQTPVSPRVPFESAVGVDPRVSPSGFTGPSLEHCTHRCK